MVARTVSNIATSTPKITPLDSPMAKPQAISESVTPTLGQK